MGPSNGTKTAQSCSSILPKYKRNLLIPRIPSSKGNRISTKQPRSRPVWVGRDKFRLEEQRHNTYLPKPPQTILESNSNDYILLPDTTQNKLLTRRNPDSNNKQLDLQNQRKRRGCVRYGTLELHNTSRQTKHTSYNCYSISSMQTQPAWDQHCIHATMVRSAR